MSMSPDDLWEAVLGELELSMTHANFHSWCKDTFILTSTDEDEFIIGVPNAFTQNWLQHKYHSNILNSMRRILDHDVKKITYEVCSKHKQQLLQSVTAAATAPEVIDITAAAVSTPTPPIKTPTVDRLTTNKIALEKAQEFGLNARYTFENFVVGKKNELAHAACVAVAKQPGMVYNPLFIYGGVGLGKTHLMQAVGHYLLSAGTDKKILYVTSETFTNEFIKAVGEGHAQQFKQKYRSVDLLMVDDIQFLAGKEGTQEEFFHTFNYLHQYNKQVILTSDRPPRAISAVEDRLISRFEGGMVVDVGSPDLETRVAIIEQKCRERGYNKMSMEVARFIASTVQTNIRELEGALNNIIGRHELEKQTPTIQSVKDVLSSFGKTNKRGSVTPKKILTTVASYYEVAIEDLRGNSRKKELVTPRQISMFLMREETHASFPNIGQELGGRDHTTAMHACQKIRGLVEDDEKLNQDLAMIKQRLYNE